MTPKDAHAYAAQWGSYVRSGDPGACFYGFSPEDFAVQSEAHRADCLRYLEDCKECVKLNPKWFDVDELEKLGDLGRAIEGAGCKP